MKNTLKLIMVLILLLAMQGLWVWIIQHEKPVKAELTKPGMLAATADHNHFVSLDD